MTTTFNAPKVRVAGRLYPALLNTPTAAAWLGTSPARLREHRPIKPVNVGIRLKWSTLAIARLAGLPAEIVTDGETAVPA